MYYLPFDRLMGLWIINEFLKAEITDLNNRKKSFFQLEDNHETRIAKSENVHRFKHELKITFNFLR